jgi:hypothetical protein
MVYEKSVCKNDGSQVAVTGWIIGDPFKESIKLDEINK